MAAAQVPHVEHVFLDLIGDDDDSRPVSVPEGLQHLEEDNALLTRLRQIMQNPIPRPFCREDLAWEHFVTFGSGHNVVSEIAVIPWHRLQDFVDEEQGSKMHPCKFLKEITKKNPISSLQRPCAYSPLIQIE
jgi:hypothetical protein